MFMKDSELWQEYSKRYVSSNEMATLILWLFNLCDKNNNMDPKRQFWGFYLLMHVALPTVPETGSASNEC